MQGDIDCKSERVWCLLETSIEQKSDMFVFFSFLCFIGMLHTHPIGIEPTTSPFILLLWEKEVLVKL